MTDKKGKIFNIQRFSVSDGPGIRTTVFFKGCNLRCAWCHNPEGQKTETEWLIYKNKCIGCGRCENLTEKDTDFICFQEARELCGKEYTLEEVMREILKDKAFYDNSGGGVTFSGGECMLQIEFLEEILKECKKHNIHTAVDTAGHVPFEYFERIFPYTDLFLYDVKCFGSEKHKRYTDVDNEVILENLTKLLATDKSVYIRIPVIEGINDSAEEMKRIKSFLDEHGVPENIELLPYHALGESKYEALGKKAAGLSAPCKEKMAQLKSIFQ